ncbi:hypothetical protein D3C76_1496710 [compost metagenome]
MLPINSSAAPKNADMAGDVGRKNHSSPASHTITSVMAIKVQTGQRISSRRVQITATNSAPMTSSTSGSGQNRESVI